jgi:hypothetical protein
MYWMKKFAMIGMIWPVWHCHKHGVLFIFTTYHHHCWPFLGSWVSLIYFSGVHVVQFVQLHVLTVLVPSWWHPLRFPGKKLCSVWLYSFLYCRNSCFIYVICILRILVSTTFKFVSLNCNVTGHTNGTGTDYQSRTPAFTLDIQWDSC